MPKDDYRTVSEDAQNPEEQADIDEHKVDDGLHQENLMKEDIVEQIQNTNTKLIEDEVVQVINEDERKNILSDAIETKSVKNASIMQADLETISEQAVKDQRAQIADEKPIVGPTNILHLSQLEIVSRIGEV